MFIAHLFRKRALPIAVASTLLGTLPVHAQGSITLYIDTASNGVATESPWPDNAMWFRLDYQPSLDDASGTEWQGQTWLATDRYGDSPLIGGFRFNRGDGWLAGSISGLSSRGAYIDYRVEQSGGSLAGWTGEGRTMFNFWNDLSPPDVRYLESGGITLTPVPEPQVWALALLGVPLVAWRHRARQHA